VLTRIAELENIRQQDRERARKHTAQARDRAAWQVIAAHCDGKSEAAWSVFGAKRT